MEQQIRVRFAPSPTGYLHIGGARTALFNWLYARNQGGTFILRIEDTDLVRSTKESERAIFEGMRWLGMDWDEGADVGGAYGPYRQTERIAIYRKYAQQLIEQGLAYYCYCTEEELAAQRQEFIEKGEMPRYSGCCRSLTDEQRAKYTAEGRKPVVRFRVPDDRKVMIHDLVRGDVEIDTATIGDFVIIKSDGVAAYNFAVVIDDALMKMTHVIRGEDHLTNTARQILVYEALGFALPQFAHISMILGPDRTKLSKRHGHTAIEKYKEEGYLPETIFNFLALLGWSPETNDEIMTKDALIQQFSLDRVAKNAAVFDIEKLKWMNNHYIRQADPVRLTRLVIPYLVDAGYLLTAEVDEKDFNWLQSIVVLTREGISRLSEFAAELRIFFVDDFTITDPETLAVLEEATAPEVIETFIAKLAELTEVNPETVYAAIKATMKATKLKGRSVFMPIRVALTGQMHGKELPNIVALLGQERSIGRIRATLANL